MDELHEVFDYAVESSGIYETITVEPFGFDTVVSVE